MSEKTNKIMADITFVVPIYNAEKYLSQCLESILKQNVHKEILCINDGSTDNSIQILKEFAREYPEIRIIDKENEGVSKARNIGIEQAKGRYLWFVDADDYLLVNNMVELINLADDYQIDILRGILYRELDDGQLSLLAAASNKVNQQLLENKKYAEFISSSEYLLGSIKRGFSPKITAGFYRTEFLKQNQCYFPNNPVNNAEDEYFEMLIFSNTLTAKICEISIPFYFYRNNHSSSTKSQLKQFEGSLIIFPLILDLCNKIEDKIIKIDKKDSLYYEAQKLLWAVRFIALRLNLIGCCDIYLDLNENDRKEIKHLIKKQNLHYLDEFKNMILACDKGGYYPFIYAEISLKIAYTKNLLNSTL